MNLFTSFLPLLNGPYLIAEEGKPLNDFPRIANHFRYNKVTIGKKNCHQLKTMKIVLQTEVNSAVFISFMIEKIISMQLAACH